MPRTKHKKGAKTSGKGSRRSVAKPSRNATRNVQRWLAAPLLLIAALALALFIAWNPWLVAFLFNGGRPITPGFSDIVAYFRLVCAVVGIVLALAGIYAWLRPQSVARFARRHRAGLLNIALLAGTILFIAIVGEIAVRVFVGSETYDGGGAGLRDSISRIQFNSMGFRDKEYPAQKPVDVTRILVLGDSFTFGQGIVNTSDLWPERLEAALNAKSPGKYEVINTGKNGFNPPDELATLKATISLKPDIVIDGYFFNDAVPDSELRTLAKPKTAIQKLVKGTHLFLFSNSYLYSFLYIRWTSFKVNTGLQKPFPDALDSVYRDHAHELTIHDSQLLEMQRISEANGAQFIILLLPANYDFTHYPLLDGHKYMDAFCEKNHVTCIDLLHAFQGQDYTQTRVSPYDSHPSPLGHKVIADAVMNATTFKNALATA